MLSGGNNLSGESRMGSGNTQIAASPMRGSAKTRQAPSRIQAVPRARKLNVMMRETMKPQ
jgi:hypothetical protein